MEKLVKLLNEYHFSWTEYIWYFLDEKENRIYFRTKVVDKWLIDEQRISDERIISKRFGFIKWLVEKDKIQYARIPEHRYVSDHCEKCIYEWMTDNVLMWLAISDTPIDDLISYLK